MKHQGHVCQALVLGSILGLSLYVGFLPHIQLSHHILMPALEPRHAQAVGQLAVTNPVSERGSYKITIPLHQDDRALILEATVDHQQEVSFILDTGATYTTISRQTALDLGYDLEQAPHVRITTANGHMLLPKVTLKSLTLNGYTAHNVEATVMDLPKNVPFSGLLGLTFIKRHKITIDSQADRLVIEPQEG